MKEGYEKIRRTVGKLKENYNFRGLLHLTDFSNLNSIISIGYLLSRDLCYASNIEFFDAADEESISAAPGKVKSYTRFYYTDRNNCSMEHKLNIPVYLLFNEEILYLDSAIYSDGNADLRNTNFGTDFDFFNYDIDWEVVFSKKNVPESFDGPVQEQFFRKKQAELLIDEPVPIKQLKNIIFRCNADYKRACNLFGKNKMFMVEPEMFVDDRNYLMDYNIVYNRLSDSDVFIFHFSSNEPVKNDDRHEYRLYDMNEKLLRIAKVSFLESDSTDFHVEVENLPCLPVKFTFWFYGILCVEEIVG